MRNLAPLALGLVLLTSCGTTSSNQDGSEFSKPNQLMGEEIERRISEIPFQHRTDLYNNLLWLGQMGEPAIPALLRGLKHKEPKVRTSCAFALGYIGDRRTIPDLRALTNDTSEVVRMEAARSLVLMGDISHAPVLIEALDSDRVQVRYFCHEALRTATNRDFGYDHLTESLGQRRQAVLQWRNWWAEQSGDQFFAANYANQHALPMPGLKAAQDMPAAPGLEPAPSKQPPQDPMMPLEAVQVPLESPAPENKGKETQKPDQAGQTIQTGQPERR